MSLGPVEILVVDINILLILAVPVLAIVSAVFLIRRLRDHEARTARLEEEADNGRSRDEDP